MHQKIRGQSGQIPHQATEVGTGKLGGKTQMGAAKRGCADLKLVAGGDLNSASLQVASLLHGQFEFLALLVSQHGDVDLISGESFLEEVIEHWSLAHALGEAVEFGDDVAF